MPFTRNMLNVLLFLTLTIAGNVSYAEDVSDEMEEGLADFYGDEEFVSIATGTQKPIHKAPAVASVITSDDIQKMGATNLNEVLERVPGVHVSVSNLSRHDPVFSIRGIQTGFNPQILVLLNGTEFKNSFNGGLPFIFYLPLNFVERIEIIRGPGSAVYGADAFSGVINIITKKDNKEQFRIGSRTGSFDSSEFWLGKDGKISDFSYNFSLEYYKTNGDNSRIVDSDLQSILDSVFMTTASLAPSALATNQEITNVFFNFNYGSWSFENWYWNQEESGLGPGGAQAIDHSGYQTEDLYRFKVKYEKTLFDKSSFSFDFSRQLYNQKTLFVLLPAGTVVPVGSDGNLNFITPAGISLFNEGIIGKPTSNHSDTRLNFELNYNELEKHNFRFAAGWLKQDLDTSEFKNFGPGVIDGTQSVVNGSLNDVSNTPFVYISDTNRDANYFSIQDEWSLANDWEVTLGVRYDDYSDFGDAINPRAALVWQTSLNLTTKLLYGKAFRPPSFLERLLKNNPVSLGNLNLKEEEINTVELAFDYRTGLNSKIALNLFNYKASNIIDVVADLNATTRTYQNARDQKGKGFEVTYDWDVTSALKTHINFANQSAKAKSNFIDGGYTSVADVPEKSFYLDVSYQINDNWFFSSQVFKISNRNRLATDLRPAIDDYSNINMLMQYSPDSQNWKLYFLVKNLTNEDQREPSDGNIENDYPLEKRKLWFGFELTL